MSEISRTTLELLIWPVGIQKIKARNLINMSRYLLQEEHGIVPRVYGCITKITGVGRKIGLVTLYEAYKINAGIAVDTHLLKIFSALGWVDKQSRANKAGLLVQGWMPKPEWGRMNEIYAGFGQLLTTRKNNDVSKFAEHYGGRLKQIYDILEHEYTYRSRKITNNKQQEENDHNYKGDENNNKDDNKDDNNPAFDITQVTSIVAV